MLPDILDRYSKANVINEPERHVYLNHHERHVSDDKQLATNRIEAEVSNRLKVKEDPGSHAIPRNFYARSIVAPKLNTTAPYEGSDDGVACNLNVFDNENLGAKLTFVDDYFKNQRKQLIDKRIEKIEGSRNKPRTPRKALNPH